MFIFGLILIILAVIAGFILYFAKESKEVLGAIVDGYKSTKYVKVPLNRNWLYVPVGVIVVGFIIMIFGMIFVVHQGEAAVRFDPLGSYNAWNPETGQYEKTSISPDEYEEGIHIKAPWVSIDRYNVKTQDYTMSIIEEEGQLERDDRVRTVTSEGLYVGLDITVLYKLDMTQADDVRRTIGRDGEYQQIVVRPEIRSTIREVVSKYEAADIYGTGRTTVQAEIFDGLVNSLGPRGFIIESVLLRDVELPAEITKAIEAKKQAEQEAMRMEYVLQKEELEKERKIIEAEGIQQAQAIINESLTPAYLSWYWINNLQNHESVVYIVPGENGLPIFKEIGEIP